MNCEIIATPLFLRNIKRLSKKYLSLRKDYGLFLSELKANPQMGIDLGGGLHKIRMRISDKNKGKSGGARVITFTVMVASEESRLYLVYVYDKSERENMTIDEIRFILRESGLVEYW